MKDELSTIEKNSTWELVDLPYGKKTIGLKWVYKVKYSDDGLIQKHKARLVAKGYSQQPGVDFSETYAHVARMETIHDLIYFGTNKAMVAEFKNQMMKEFEMTDLGLIKYFLGIQVKQSPGRIFLSQEKYIEDLFKKFNMSQCKPLSTPMALNENFQVNDDGEKADSTTAKRILRYLKGTKTQGIEFKKESECKLVGYTDSDWVGSIDDRKSISGYIFCLGSNVISWSSRKQKFVALSSAEVEYIACTNAACEAV
ncbi:uncharacterized mitochondrial protein AtMg00810-like [Impatiens glandulifera]|uniref:uncharacterized mitochondrial protein AtMg00810-like n=1 Tax=Impatiens glandulifera TaxID=253017 RepID=UPI001FB06E33|nr:uncharacterized mitochondrial protein AtMg00810-like [Impatiens glandulifera]